MIRNRWRSWFGERGDDSLSSESIEAPDNTQFAPGHPGAEPGKTEESFDLNLGTASFRCAIDLGADDAYSNWIRGGAGLEAPLDWAQRLSRPDWEVLDLGANVGIFAFGVAGNVRKVVAVEALPRNAELLAIGASMNDLPVEVVHAAVWNEPGTVRLQGFSAWGQIVATGDGVEVSAVTVADLIDTYCTGVPNLVKVDIEGAESTVLPDVFRLTDMRPDIAVIYETNQYASPEPVEELDQMARDAGFALWRLDPVSGRVSMVDPAIPQTTVYCDVLALRRSDRDDLPVAPPSTDEMIEDLTREIASQGDPHRAYVAANLDRFPAAVRNDRTLRELVEKEMATGNDGFQAALQVFRAIA